MKILKNVFVALSLVSFLQATRTEQVCKDLCEATLYACIAGVSGAYTHHCLPGLLDCCDTCADVCADCRCTDLIEHCSGQHYAAIVAAEMDYRNGCCCLLCSALSLTTLVYSIYSCHSAYNVYTKPRATSTMDLLSETAQPKIAGLQPQQKLLQQIKLSLYSLLLQGVTKQQLIQFLRMHEQQGTSLGQLLKILQNKSQATALVPVKQKMS